MNNNDLLRYKNLFLSARQELSTGKSLVDSIPPQVIFAGTRSTWPPVKLTLPRRSGFNRRAASSYVPLRMT